MKKKQAGQLVYPVLDPYKLQIVYSKLADMKAKIIDEDDESFQRLVFIVQSILLF